MADFSSSAGLGLMSSKKYGFLKKSASYFYRMAYVKNLCIFDIS
jgi:hypothetical protein